MVRGADRFVSQVNIWDVAPTPWQTWMLIPVKVEGAFAPPQPPPETFCLGSPPQYDGDATGQSSARAQHAESERDDFGTIVTEVTVVTTRKRYRVENA